MDFGLTSLSSIAKLKTGIRSRRWSSYDTTGGNADNWPIPAGKSVVIGEMKGPGCIRHIWMTTREADNNLRALTLKIYWDKEDSPSVLTPLGDFFGLGHAKGAYFQSLPIQSFYLGLNCWFPMPYEKGAKLVVTNDSEKDSFLYFYIDYQEWDEMPEDMARFHAHWHRKLVLKKSEKMGKNDRGSIERLNTTGKDNYVILDTQGKGHYVGCVLNIDTNQPGWWGEGDDMFFIDGRKKWPPDLHGTGTEDYFCGAWNYHRLNQPYSTPYFGYHFKGNPDYTGKHSQYRFHIEDPVYFERSLHFSIEHGHANDWEGDWTSTAYWYQVGRTKPLPEIGTLKDRLPYMFGGIEYWPGKDRKELPL